MYSVFLPGGGVVCLRQVVKSYRRLADRLSMQVETKTGEEVAYLLARITGFAY
jgi:hypothetical protein